MKNVIIILQYDDESLGGEWLNIENIKALLYGKNATTPELLKVVDYRKMD